MAMRLRIRTLKNETFEITISPTNTVSAPLFVCQLGRILSWTPVDRAPPFLRTAKPVPLEPWLVSGRDARGHALPAVCTGHAACSLPVFFRPFFFYPKPGARLHVWRG